MPPWAIIGERHPVTLTQAPMMRVATLLLLAVSLTASGCTSDEDEITHVVQDYNTAVGAGDGTKACAFLTKRGREIVLALDMEQALSVRTTGCVSTIKALDHLQEGREIKELKSAEIVDVHIRGTAATAALRTAEGRATAKLKQQNGKWRVDYPPGFE